MEIYYQLQLIWDATEQMERVGYDFKYSRKKSKQHSLYSTTNDFKDECSDANSEMENNEVVYPKVGRYYENYRQRLDRLPDNVRGAP